MNQQLKLLQPLALPLSKDVGANAFEKDLLDRKRLAEQLTGYLDRLRVGAVLAIDAQWGEGKTWFGLNWKKHLETEAHKVIYIDAFAQDYVEDPFLLIAAEITGLLNEDEDATKNMRVKAAGVMKAILPTASKVLVNFVGHILLGSSDMGERLDELAENVREGVADTTSKLMEKKLEDYALEKVSLDHFRTALTNLASSQTKPIVIFIDELDRCRPTFAVQFIERIKHFFNVPNLVFVLLLNKEQLESAICGVYGPKTDAALYLGKFIHLYFRLPKNVSHDRAFASSHLITFMEDMLQRYGFDDTQKHMALEFKNDLGQWIVALNLSLRDIERACALFVLTNASQLNSINTNQQETGFILLALSSNVRFLPNRNVRR